MDRCETWSLKMFRIGPCDVLSVFYCGHDLGVSRATWLRDVILTGRDNLGKTRRRWKKIIKCILKDYDLK
jgi:hypothetical protein